MNVCLLSKKDTVAKRQLDAILKYKKGTTDNLNSI